MSTNNSWNNQIAAANSAITLNAGNNAINIGTDAGGTNINIGTGSHAGNITIGNTAGSLGTISIQNSSGDIIINSGLHSSVLTSGSGAQLSVSNSALNIDSAGEPLAIKSGTGLLNISTDSAATTVSIASGAAVKTVILGSTNTTSGLTLNSGSGGIKAIGVASVSVSNKNYVTINTSTGALGSDSGPTSSISITGDTGGALTGSSFTLSGGTTGLSFGGSGSTETLTFAGITANGGTVSLATDATTSTINVGTGAGVKTSTLGSTNTTSATTVQSGSGALNVTSTNGALTVNSGTGTMGISTDASANTVNIATGGAVKTVTLGSTNSTSSTAIKSGTGNIALNSGLTVDSTGRNKNAAQPAFYAYQGSSPTNVTGDGTTYVLNLGTALLNQGSYYNTGTFTFTAPVTGLYQFNLAVILTGVGAQTTLQLQVNNSTANVQYNGSYISPSTVKAAGNFLGTNMACAILCTANDAIKFQVVASGLTKTIGVNGVDGQTFASGYLIC